MEISNTTDILDSRDIIIYINELVGVENRLDQLNWSEYDVTEFETLSKFNEEGKMCFNSTWEDGITLVRETHFRDYAYEYADEIRSSHLMEWPFNHIDWDSATEQLKMDYTEICFGNVTYFARE